MRVDYLVLSPAGANTLLAVGAGVLCGVCVTNTSAAAASNVVVYDGADGNGDQIFTLTLAANQVLSSTLAHDGIRFDHGLYVETGGGVVGSLFAALDGRQPPQPKV